MSRAVRLLVVNAGSTSLKLSVVEDGDATPVASLDAAPRDVAAVVHRVVHGGPRFVAPVVIDDDVAAQLAAVVELAPLHNGPALEALRVARRVLPGVPHVAVFDTAFHATMPAAARAYALPEHLRVGHGIRRYGFHGLSVAWAAERVAAARVVVCHLGGGCSVTAVRHGASVDTTMGFTPLEGVPMATRSGSVDPGALLHLLAAGIGADELAEVLERRSGLLGLSGISGDVAELQRSDAPEARFALDVFCHRVATAVGAMAVAAGGLDALVFTGGIGENSAPVRAGVCARLGPLDVTIDPAANEGATPDAELSRPGARVRVVAIAAREDIMAARAAREVLG